jgi:Tfp pilus assembly protein PilF
LLALCVFAAAPALGTETDDFARWMNLGKAHLENRESAKAIQAIEEAIRANPKSAPAHRNMARAQLLATKPDAALGALAKAAELERESAATNYLTGIAQIRGSRFAEAAASFETAVRLDARTATLRYQLASAYQATGRTETAAEQLRETIRLDPQHGSAHYKLANLARQAGDQAGFERHNREFLRLRKLFGDETRTAEALERCVYTLPEAHAPPIPVRQAPAIDVRFVDATPQVFPEPLALRSMLVAVIELDDDGRSVFAVADGTEILLLSMSPAGRFEWTPTKGELSDGAGFQELVVGDFHDDVPTGARYDAKIHAHNDLLLVGTADVRLLKRSGPTAFTDVTEAAGLREARGNAGRWLDYEHDGDLDLLLAGELGLALWQNNGDGRFENASEKVGITPTGPAVSAVAIDLDSNTAVDIVAARGAEPTLVFENQRAGRFAPMKAPPGPWPAARRALADDLNNDGHPDVVLVSDTEAVLIFGHLPERGRIDLAALNMAHAILTDYDNDGWLDFVAVGKVRGDDQRGAVGVWRNPAAGSWADMTTETGLKGLALPPIAQVVAADADHDGDTDFLLATASEGLRWLRNDGGNGHKQLKARLHTIKTNPSAIGTHIEGRAGDYWLTRNVTGLPIEIGVGARTRLDSVQTVWTNGVVDNEIDVAVSNTPLTLVEKNVATGSCPFLYAWDGARFRFVTDLLGNSPLGLSLTRDAVLPADPDEIVWVGDESSVAAKEGAYELAVTSEFREVVYLDQARLMVVDHPAEVEMHPTDKLMFPPFPPSQVWALGLRRSLAMAVGDDGVDRTQALREIDAVFADPGPPLPSPYRGACHPLEVTLDFGDIEVDRPWVLALTGWLQYGDASTNIALSQNKAVEMIPPALFAETGESWTKLDVVVGMPAGKTKTILCDLGGKLPPGTRRLRLSTTFEVRWDRIALSERRPSDSIRIQELSPATARLAWRGFSDLRSRAAGQPTTPDYDRVSDTPPWKTTLEGWCTAYGDVLPLVTGRDDRLVLLNGGDALTLRFDAGSLAPPPAGLRRSFFFYSVGWDKDGDHNVVDGDRVEPLPVNNAADPLSESDWQMQYNTRWVPAHRFRAAR